MYSKLVLVFNCGSSSVKFALVDPVSATTACSGSVQRIGQSEADLQIKLNGKKQQYELPYINYHAALQKIISILKTETPELYDKIFVIGHRVVHGGEDFSASVLINDDVIRAIKRCSNLAPLHNPANISGIEEARKAFPHLPQVAVFDTAFHQTIPPYAFIYPIPYEYYQQHKIRRYGFHGTSHRFVSIEAAKKLNKNLIDCSFITAHLGNGCSATAIANGKSVDTTMGLTPLEGLMMGTRSGSIDPSLHAHLSRNLGLDSHAVTEILNKKSGLLGISGAHSDMRAIEAAVEKGDERAQLALDVFCYRLAKSISALCAPLAALDALIFTGGIGENSPLVRAKTLGWLKLLRFSIDNERNRINGKNSNGIITIDSSSAVAMVIPTNEELLIAQDSAALTKNA